MGGLSRRNKVIEERRAEGPVVVVDAGRSLAKALSTNTFAEDGTQRLAKGRLLAEGIALGGVDAITLGPEDWSLGTAEVRAMVAELKLPLLAANLWCDGAKPYPGHVVVERGGRKVGIVGFTEGEVEGCEVRAPRNTLVAELVSMGEVDLALGLFPVGSHRTIDIVGEGLDLDVIVDAHRNRLATRAEPVGTSLVVGSGPKGQRVGLTTLAWTEGTDRWMAVGGTDDLGESITRTESRIASLQERHAKENKDSLLKAVERLTKQLEDLKARQAAAQVGGVANTVAITLVTLEDNIANHEPTEALVQAFLRSTEEAAPAAVAPKGPRTAPANSPYAGAATCAGCHPAIAKQWEGTGHASAWKSLVDDGHAADQDCFSCHATGAGEKGGPAKPAEVAGLRDVQCEACHGPARAHTRDPDNAALHPLRAPGPEVCTTCHDGERDMGQFDLSTYLPKVMHTSPESK